MLWISVLLLLVCAMLPRGRSIRSLSPVGPRSGAALFSRALLLLSVLTAAAAQAQPNPPGIRTLTSPDGGYLVATRTVPVGNLIWMTEFDGTRIVVFRLDAQGGRQNLVFDGTLPGRLPAEIAWTPDSQYVVFTTTSSGGHSPWHSNAYVVSIPARRMVEADPSVGLVVTTDFTLSPPHTATFGIGIEGANGVDFEHPKATPVDLSSLFKESSPHP